MRRFLLLSLGLIALLVCSAPSAAETRYVTDVLEITLRTGESTRYRILRMLPSGTPLTVLGTNEGSGYARVTTPDGTTGYVLINELQTEPPARQRLAEMDERIAQLEVEPKALSAELERLREDYATLTADLEQTQRQRQLLEQELATLRHASANIVEITSDRERLRLQVSQLMRERADLEQANQDLSHQNQQRWFLIGAGVIFTGVIIGLILPQLRFRRRRSSWGSL